MKSVNVKLFAIKHKLIEKLTKSLNADKELIKNGAELTQTKYAKIQLVECTKSTLDKDKVKELCNKYGIDISTLEKATTYKRLDIDNISTEVTDIVDNVFNTLDNDNTDKAVSRIAASINKSIK